jgi:hypothetical protein
MNTLNKSPMLGGGRAVGFYRWLLCRWTLRRLLILLAWLATLVALFYGEENWRGRRAWEQCRRELVAKGEVLDWNAYIPAPVPDEQNIYKAPKIAEWFLRESSVGAISGGIHKANSTNAPFRLSPSWNATTAPLLLAKVDVVPSSRPVPAGNADAVLQFDAPSAREQAAKLLLQTLGPCSRAVWGGMVVGRALDHIYPAHLVVRADTVPTTEALGEFFPRSPAPYNAFSVLNPPDLNGFQVTAVGTNTFHVSLKFSVWTPGDYLAASQSAVTDLDLLRKALERPFARLECNYDLPYARPIPDFVRMRTAAHMLSQRAQCYLLLGQPEAAWQELALVRDMCRMLESKPDGNYPLPLEALIDVAINELYMITLQDGLRLRVWREPQLAAMQKQLMDINLLPLLRQAIKVERAALCRAFETAPPVKLLGIANVPRGWIYQNMCTVALLDQLAIEPFDAPGNQVLPGKADEIENQKKATLSHRTPNTFLAAIAMPNLMNPTQIMARNQTLANQAYIACGLERYRLAHGKYPETLDALVPQFAAKLPLDVVGGNPLKYHRTADGRFLLYSVGWNGKDDEGVPGKTTEEGDWVWQ